MKTLQITFISILTIVFLGCSPQKSKDFEHLEKYFKETHKFKINDKIDKIVVLTEGASCASCDKIFARTAFEHLQNENTVYLVTATGNIVDIQPFLMLEKNCFFDWQLNRAEYSEFSSSRVIYLKNNVIDTIIIINSNEIREQLEYLKNKLL